MITIRDIHRRLKLLPESADVGKNYFSYLERAETAINSGDPRKIMKMIESGINDTTNSILLDTMLNLYDALYIYGGNASNIRHYGHLIAEDYVARTRDAKEAQTYLKRKLGRIKSSISTKPNKSIQSIQDAIKSAIEGVKDKLPTNTGTATLTPSNDDQQEDKPSEEKNEAFIMSYQNMLDEATKMIYCDRILDNYNRISKRFNIDRIIQENIYDNSIDDTIGYICRLIETYDVPDKVKYNTALETVWYGFAKNYVDCSSSQFTTMITDYFLAKGNNRRMCSKLLEASMIVNKDDYQGNLDVITEEEPEDEDYNKLSYDSLNSETAHIQDQIRHQLLGVNEIRSIRLNEEVDFNKIFRDFKSSDESHKETKLKWLIGKLFSKNPNDIVNGIPTVLNYIRIVFVLGAFALNPIIGAVSAIADIFLALKTNREQTKKMLEAIDNEIKVSKRKLSSSNNPDEKKRLEKYIKELEAGYQKIDEYYETKLTDEEIDKKYEEKYSDDNDTNDFDFGDDFGDDDFNMNEACIVKIGTLAERYDKLPVKKFGKKDIETIVNTSKLYSEMADVSVNLPDIIDPILLESVLDEHIAIEKGKSHYESTLYNRNKYLLTEAKSKITNSNLNTYDSKTFYDDLVRLEVTVNVLEALNDIKTSCDYYHPLIEGSFTNSIKLASEKVKKTLQKLSDKEKSISKSIDVAANNTKKAMEKSLTTDNREAVIKGSVLPSASKTIKLAITTAGLALINPALAVIGALGYMAVSKRYKAKERQMIIDEIEIEMKMCEKYIEIAESKNDMVALKKLLTIQRELERQRQRIKYNMKVKFGQKYFDSSNAPAYTIDDD